MRHRRRILALIIIELIALGVISLLVIQNGSRSLVLGWALLVITMAAVATAAGFLSGRISPVETAYTLGFDAGYREGRRSQTLNVVPFRRAKRADSQP